MPFKKVAVLVPLDICIAVRDLDKPHTRFGKSPSQNTLTPKVFRDLFVEPIHGKCLL